MTLHGAVKQDPQQLPNAEACAVCNLLVGDVLLFVCLGSGVEPAPYCEQVVVKQPFRIGKRSDGL